MLGGKAICPKHEWGYTLAEGCPWCPPKPRTRVYRNGDPVTDVHVGMVLEDQLGRDFRVRLVDGDRVCLESLSTRTQCWESLDFIRLAEVRYAEDFEAPEGS